MSRLHGAAMAAILACLATNPAAAQNGPAHGPARGPARAPAPRVGNVRLSPYIEAAQVLAVDVKDGDVLTYTQVSAGLNASVATRRVTATIAARYDRNFQYRRDVADTNVVTGLGRVSAALAPGFTIDGGAIATRARSDIRGAAPTLTQGNLANSSEVISADAGPSLASHVGPIGVAASYRFGGTHVSAPSAKTLPAGSRPLDNYASSRRHLATASAGIKPGRGLPVGLSASGAYERENASQLDQRYEGYYGRGDVVLPVSAHLALTAGAGYENIEISQRDPVVDGAGVPVLDRNGRYLSNRAAPRRIAFDTTGLFWDAGVLYRTARTTLQARAGRRYDSMSYTGSLQWQASSAVGLNVGVYDGILSFGRQLRGGVAAIPAAFVTTGDRLSENFTGCTFGQTSAQAGGCLNAAFQSIATANYRARGIDAVLSARHGPTTFGLGAGYANRRFLLPDGGPNLTVVNNANDESVYVQAFASQALSPDSGIDLNLRGTMFDSEIAGAVPVYSVGASGGYYHRFGNLGATATVGMYGYDSKAIAAQVQAQARLGLRYGF